MTGTKVVIIVLVVIAALFVVLMIWGSGNNSSQTTFNTNEPHAALAWLSQLGSAPGFDVTQLQPSVKIKTFDLAKQAKYQFKVVADSDHPFRQAAFKVQPAASQSCAQVVFTDPSGGGSSSDDPNHPTKLKNPQSSWDTKNPNSFTLTIPKGGGELLIERRASSSTAPCAVTLQ